MNTQNYASLEACKRLVDSGIVLETDCIYSTEGKLLIKALVPIRDGDIPAVSTSDILMELPENIEGDYLSLTKQDGFVAYYGRICNPLHSARNTNPTDALIDLLIWVRREK